MRVAAPSVSGGPEKALAYRDKTQKLEIRGVDKAQTRCRDDPRHFVAPAFPPPAPAMLTRNSC
jgi:hypothetical protein